MISIIILVISILLDGILTNFIPYLVNDLSLFTPLLTVTTIFIIYPLFRKKEKKYFIILFITGIIYDLLYTNLLFFNGVLFVFLGLISKYIHKNYELSYIKLILFLIIIITIYESVTGLLLLIFNIVPITLYKIFYKIIHSIILNIIYGEIIYLIIKLVPKKYKKISMN